MYEEDIQKEEENVNGENLVNSSVEKTIDETTYRIDQENKGYTPSFINNGKIAFANKPKKLVKRPSIFSSNIGPSNQGFVKMAGLGVILAVLIIVILLVFNRM